MFDLKKVFLIIVCLIVLILNRQKIITAVTPTKVPTPVLKNEVCTGKKLCAIAYVAPWCPGCNSLIPNFKQYLAQSKNHSEYGFVIIVGKGKTMRDNTDKAIEIGSKEFKNIIVDVDESFHRDLKIKYYPSFIIVKPNQKIVMRDQEAFDWINQHFLIQTSSL